jgi:hypothetical protein
VSNRNHIFYIEYSDKRADRSDTFPVLDESLATAVANKVLQKWLEKCPSGLKRDWVDTDHLDKSGRHYLRVTLTWNDGDKTAAGDFHDLCEYSGFECSTHGSTSCS